MLILTRRRGEKIVIGNHSKVTILAIDNRTIKLGVDSPNDIAVHREEIYHKIQQKKKLVKTE